MSPEVNLAKDVKENRENIEGRDFRVSTVEWDGFTFNLKGFALPKNWESLPKKIDETLATRPISAAMRTVPDNSLVEFDPVYGIITRLKLDNSKRSGVYLDKSMVNGGVYISEGITSLSTAVLYQKMLAKYLEYVTDYKIAYPYIIDAGRDYSGSSDLSIPENVLNSKKTLTNDYYQSHFEKEAWRISGMFGTKVRYCRFSDNGVLDVVQIDSDDCNYCLSGRTYSPHNVDSVYQAATLHNICAKFINDMLDRKK